MTFANVNTQMQNSLAVIFFYTSLLFGRTVVCKNCS